MARLNRTTYSKGTWSEMTQPWGLLVRAAAVCEDGRVRTVRVGNPDTYFSAPARVSFRGKTVTGFITWKSDSGLSTDPEQWIAFTATGKHKDVFSRKALCESLRVSEDIPDGILNDLAIDHSEG